MFGIGFPELMLIMVIGLFIIGPEKLPDIAKTLGKTLAEFKKVVDGVKDSIEEEQAKVEKSLETPGDTMSLKEKSDALTKEYEETKEETEEGEKKA